MEHETNWVVLPLHEIWSFQQSSKTPISLTLVHTNVTKDNGMSTLSCRQE